MITEEAAGRMEAMRMVVARVVGDYAMLYGSTTGFRKSRDRVRASEAVA